MNSSLLRVIATGHAMSHAVNNEPWLCQCLACRFTKEYKILVQEDESVKEATVADSLLVTMRDAGYNTQIL